MEFELEGVPRIEVEGSTVVELPSYMTLLPKEELREALASAKRNCIIAAGSETSANDIVLSTASGELMQLDRVAHHLSESQVEPFDAGEMLKFTLLRNGYSYTIFSVWAVDNAETIVSLGRGVEYVLK